MTKEQMVEALRNKAKEDKVANAIFHMFALRDRSRSDVTIVGLSQAMKHEGFNFKRDEYQKFLRFLSSIGIGQLMQDSKNKVKGIKDIHLTLESIGRAAIGKEIANLDAFVPRKKFNELIIIPKENKTEVKVGVSMSVNGRSYNIDLPEDLTNTEIASVLETIRGKSNKT